MENSYELIIPREIENELSFINRGIVSFYLGGRLFFFFVSDQQELDLINKSNNISLELAPILRDEFPSVRVIFTFYMDKLKVKNFDHYFSLESIDDIKHLQQLYSDGKMILVLYADSPKYLKKYVISDSDLQFMKYVLDEIECQVDKTGQFNDNKPSI